MPIETGSRLVRRVRVSDEDNNEEDGVDINKALHSLEEIPKYENAIWTKISQPRLEELLKGHEDYIQGYLGAKRASLKLLDMS